MAGRNENEAFRNYIKPIQQTLHCVTLQRLTRRDRTQLTADTTYSVSLRDMDSVPLVGDIPLHLVVGQVIRIARTSPDNPGGGYTVNLVQYFYAFTTSADQEILSFHWTPEATGESAVTFPHLHVGPALLAGQTVIRPRDLHKAHIPTGLVSIEAIVRLAITEFRVTPLRSDWERILGAGGIS